MAHRKLNRILSGVAVCLALSSLARAQSPDRLLIHGNLVTPDGVFNGWLDVRDGRIERIEKVRPTVTGVPTLDTSDFIFPGFIDLHNHPAFNIFPRWSPPRKFANRYEWRTWDVYRHTLEEPAHKLMADESNFCDIDEYVEVKALLGGTTSMIGFGERTPGRTLPHCIEGLVRNLDHYTGFYGHEQGQERIVNSIGILPRDMDANVAADVAHGIANGKIDLFTIHIAEGLPTDEESTQELDKLEAHGLLTPNTALIHSVGLSPAQLARVHKAGASIVWSPRSNFELYGATANVDAAFREGVSISLAPDWSPTGSDNMLDEITYAWGVSQTKLSGLFSPRQLVEMASIVPARVAHIDDKVGSIAPGMLADLFFVHAAEDKSLTNPYDFLVRQTVNAIDLVIINGVPTYGDPAIFHQLQIRTEPLEVCGMARALNAEALPDGSFAAVTARLREKMKGAGTSLAPLAECARP